MTRRRRAASRAPLVSTAGLACRNQIDVGDKFSNCSAVRLGTLPSRDQPFIPAGKAVRAGGCASVGRRVVLHSPWPGPELRRCLAEFGRRYNPSDATEPVPLI